MMNHAVLEAHDLRFRYGRKWAVDGVTLRLHAGEVMALVGHNGAGKTSAIRMLTGMVPPTSGDVLVQGERLERDRLDLRQHLGYVPDRPAVFERLTCREYIRFVCGLFGIGRDDADRAADPLLERFELLGVEDHLLGTYSHGMRQKAVLVSVLAHRPSILILDEPIVGLDPRSARHLRRILREEAGKGTAVLFSTHVLSVAEEVADRAAVIHRGKILSEGTVPSLVARTPGARTLEDAFFALTDDEVA